MRSNGAVHVGNDTFLFTTRDAEEEVYLFTSSFPREEQRSPLQLDRRVRMTPHSTLHCPPEDTERYVDALRSAAKSLAPRETKQPSSAATAPPLSSPFLSAASQPGQAEWDRVLRHSLHVSADGTHVVAMSTSRRQHYLIDIRSEPAEVCEFTTDDVVRAVCWHPSVSRWLLVLLVTGECVVYDVCNTHLGVVIRWSHRIPVKDMLLQAVLAEEAREGRRADGTSGLAAAFAQQAHEKETLAERTASREVQEEKNLHRMGSVATPSKPSMESIILEDEDEDEHEDGAAYPSHRGHSGNRTTASSSVNTSLTTATAAVGSGGGGGGAAAGSTTPSTTTGTRVALNAYGLPLSSASGGFVATSRREQHAAPPSLFCAPTTSATAASRTLPGPAQQPPTSSPTVFAPSLPPPQTESNSTPTRNRSGRPPLTTSPFPSPDRSRASPAPATGRASPSRALLRLSPHAATGAVVTIPQAQERAHPTSPYDVVALHIIAPTRSLPPTLLLLCSSGDVFAAKLDDQCEPTAAAAATAPEAKSTEPTATTTTTETAVVVQTRWRHASARSVLHRVVYGGSATYDEEALALCTTLMDEDSGVHAVVVCYSSGVVRTYCLDEPALLARKVIPRASRGRRDALQKQTFVTHIGPAFEARALLSPAVPSTSHVVQLSVSGNVILIRCGDADAYLLALPTWDHHRKGWSYWRPACPDPDERAQEALRLPLVSQHSAAPPPLALRVPFDVQGASLALGLREVVVIPEVAALNVPTTTTAAAGGDAKAPGSVDYVCPREHTVAVHVVPLLRSAMYAQCEEFRLSYDGDAVEDAKDDEGNGVAGKAVGSGSSSPAADERRQSRSQLGSSPSKGALTVPPRTSAAAAGTTPLLTLLHGVAECHRELLCGFPVEEVDVHTAGLAARVDNVVQSTKQKEQELARRTAQLQEKLAQLARRSARVNADVAAWRRLVLDALVHRRGVQMMCRAQQRLQEVGAMLDEYETTIDRRLNGEAAQ